jgi:hypothetical protein
MARHRLTTEEQKKGTQRALESPRTPSQLKKGLKKRQQQLEGNSTSKKNTQSSKQTDATDKDEESTQVADESFDSDSEE